MVDDQFTAGNISANLRDELKTRIDSSDAPLGVAMLAGVRMHRMEGRPGRRKDRQDDDQSGEDDGGTTEQPSTSATPSI